ncbi:MAG TPA: FAD-dependent oxidoreductase, partial [Aggregatilineales bacterium]|nr:FAD-dependent oxidoreductase [Aggregatilineales bacterium]
MATRNDGEFPATADVVIIGGGLAGTAALWALECAEPGLQTVLIEQNDFLGGGSSLASLECFRSCWSLPCNARLMERSIEVFYNPHEFFGDGTASIGVRKHGYLFCGFSSEQAAKLKSEVEHMHSIGLDHVEYLDTDGVQHRFPWLGEKV